MGFKKGENMKNKFFFIMILILFLALMINLSTAQIRDYDSTTGECYETIDACANHPSGNIIECDFHADCDFELACYDAESCCCKPCPPEGYACSTTEECNPGATDREYCLGFVCSNDHCCPEETVWAGDGCAEIYVDPSSRDFETILVGSCSSTKNFEVTNIGTGTLTGNVSVSAPFFCSEGCDYSLTNGETQTAKIEFCPTAKLIYSRTVSFSGGGGATTTGTGTGTSPDVSYTLTVSKLGTGSGTITGSGIDCGTDCSQSYVNGTSVTLSASAASGSTFKGWSGACSGTGSCEKRIIEITSCFQFMTV